ncbi:hypothetical protein HMPREF1977_0032 [Capnocytophaga ochracea F0287]|uniref:Uncharacterized protein n=1 Tax=Capnocytophaga ochracea F0287 TaxID=873517 RepID=E4MNS2_CAPOC|nr:hypothetical protein HMPREF1977_0032 [Capnocytophaga ochracea F0287]
MEATRNALAEGLSVYLTLAKFKTLPKFEMKKRRIGEVRRRRKISEENERELRRILVKKGCEEGGVSL